MKSEHQGLVSHRHREPRTAVALEVSPGSSTKGGFRPYGAVDHERLQEAMQESSLVHVSRRPGIGAPASVRLVIDRRGPLPS